MHFILIRFFLKNPPCKNQIELRQAILVMTEYSGFDLRPFAGTWKSTSLDIQCQDWRVQVAGEIGAWGAHGGTRETRITLKHDVEGQTSPALQVQ